MGVSLIDLTRCHDDSWSLYYVSGTAGDNRKSNGVPHFFRKLLLIPVGAKGYGKANCKAQGWKLVGHWNASTDTMALPQLRSLLKGFEKEDGFERCHVHLGIHMEILAAVPAHSHNDKKSLPKTKKALMVGKSRNDKISLKQINRAVMAGKRHNDKTSLKKKKQVVSARKGQKNKTSSKRAVTVTRTQQPPNEWIFTI